MLYWKVFELKIQAGHNSSSTIFSNETFKNFNSSYYLTICVDIGVIAISSTSWFIIINSHLKNDQTLITLV